MLDVTDLACVRGERHLFRGVGFRLETGGLLHVRGQNGSGKTTLLRTLCGLAPAAEGTIRWAGQEIGRLGEDYRRQLCYLGHANAIKDELTPTENLRLAARLNGDAPDAAEGEDETAAFAALAAVGLAGREDLPCRFLSQGQKRRVALARLVGQARPLWILDEPFVALDTASIDIVRRLIGAHLEHGGLAVLTTHQAVDFAPGVVRSLSLD